MNGLGARIKYFREWQGLTQADLEEKTGIKREYISKLENGELENPTYLTLSKIAQGIGIAVSELLEASPAQDLKPMPVIKIITSLANDQQLYLDVENGRYVTIPIVDNLMPPNKTSLKYLEGVQDYALIKSDMLKNNSALESLVCMWTPSGEESMSPIIKPNSLICVDLSQQDPQQLNGKIALLKDATTGCLSRYLRLDKNLIIGLPQDVSLYHAIIIPLEEKERILGRVIWCWAKIDD